MNRLRNTAFPILMLSLAACPLWAQEPAEKSGKQLAFALQEAFADAIEKAEPSLVSVVRIRVVDGLAADSLLGPHDDQRLMEIRRQIELRRGLARDLVHPSWTDTFDPNWMPQDYGSGVVIDENGLVLTNHHVIERADRLWVILHDGRVVPATIWAGDPRSDLAILRIHVKGLRPIKVGDASKVKKGHLVLALGNLLAMARDGRASASWGIVANIARRLPPPGSNSPDELTLHHSGTLFQTDARLNYGTSGGAMINLQGEMIGLVTALAAVRGFDQAAGYAIPLDDTMKRIISLLREGREVEYGFLGIIPQDYRRGGDQEPESVPSGALVKECYIGSPGYQGGLQPGDIITAVDGKKVTNREELVLTVGTRFAGNRIPFEIIRNGQRINLTMTLGEFPVTGQIYASVRPPAWRGLRVDYTSLLLRAGQQRLGGLPDGGVLVTEVESGSPAANAGLAIDAIITHIGGVRVRSPAEFYDVIRTLKGTVEIRTDGEKFTVGE